MPLLKKRLGSINPKQIIPNEPDPSDVTQPSHATPLQDLVMNKDPQTSWENEE